MEIEAPLCCVSLLQLCVKVKPLSIIMQYFASQKNINVGTFGKRSKNHQLKPLELFVSELILGKGKGFPIASRNGKP